MEKNTMTKAEIASAKKRIKVLEKALTECVPLMRGSIVSNGIKHKQPYFSLNKDKKTHLIYLGEARLPSAKLMADNYKMLINVVEEMTMLNLMLLKNNVLNQ